MSVRERDGGAAAMDHVNATGVAAAVDREGARGLNAGQGRRRKMD